MLEQLFPEGVHPYLAVAEEVCRALFYHLRRGRKIVREPEVVGIEKCYPLPFRGLYSSVSRVARAQMRVLEDPDLSFRKPRANLADSFNGTVSRTVVGYDHLEIIESLGERALKRGRYVRSRVIRGYDDRYERHQVRLPWFMRHHILKT